MWLSCDVNVYSTVLSSLRNSSYSNEGSDHHINFILGAILLYFWEDDLYLVLAMQFVMLQQAFNPLIQYYFHVICNSGISRLKRRSGLNNGTAIYRLIPKRMSF